MSAMLPWAKTMTVTVRVRNTTRIIFDGRVISGPPLTRRERFDRWRGLMACRLGRHLWMPGPSWDKDTDYCQRSLSHRRKAHR